MNYNRTYNFSAGPATMPEPVLEEIRDEMMNYRGSGMCVMEMSHRSPVYQQGLRCFRSFRSAAPTPPKITTASSGLPAASQEESFHYFSQIIRIAGLLHILRIYQRHAAYLRTV